MTDIGFYVMLVVALGVVMALHAATVDDPQASRHRQAVHTRDDTDERGDDE